MAQSCNQRTNMYTTCSVKALCCVCKLQVTFSLSNFSLTSGPLSDTHRCSCSSVTRKDLCSFTALERTCLFASWLPTCVMISLSTTLTASGWRCGIKSVTDLLSCQSLHCFLDTVALTQFHKRFLNHEDLFLHERVQFAYAG